ncbi:MAG TPA: choice-of-anchor D domain-containing protein, partial [Terriglobales bacterium]|nr:choice-of-anchor D domain-containing protein [Terriglobales bacterium]
LLNTGGTRMTTSSSVNPSVIGQSVTFTTTIAAGLRNGGTPTGTITFMADSTIIGSSPISAGEGSFTTSSLAGGSHIISAIYSGDTVFNANTAPPYTQTVIAGTPAVTLSPTSLTFGVVAIGSVGIQQNVTLTNTGNATLTITSITASGDFVQTNTCGGSVASGASCTISVNFKPRGIGTRTGAVNITDDAPGSPQSVSLTGTGTAVKLAPTSVSFGQQTVGIPSPPKTVTLTNTSGTLTVHISSMTFTGNNPPDFTQTNTCGASVAPKTSCTISVVFTPGAIGARSATLNVNDDGGGSPQTVKLAGTGI